MRVKCPRCLHNLDLPESQGATLVCPDCQARFDKSGNLLPVPAPRAALPVTPLRRVPGPYEMDPIEYEDDRQERQEERQERREKRVFRQEERQDYREERFESKERNTFAIVGFSLELCCLLFVLGGLIFGTHLKIYLGFALTLSLPLVLVGLVLSMLGIFFRKVMRPLAIVGAGIGATMLLILIPFGFMMLTSSN